MFPLQNPMNGQTSNAMTAGMMAGNNAGGQLSATQTYNMLKQQGVTLSPQQETALQQQMANEAAQSQINQSGMVQGMTAGLGNAAANVNTQRAMVLNAQANAAQNAANQLQALSNARSTNANQIGQAMQTTAGMFR
jgi:hypothetical protein